MSSPALAADAVPAIDTHLPGMIFGRNASIVVDHVSKWYGDIVAVSDVTFGVAPGVTALLGPNGAGKSTILKMMSGLTGASSGKITIDGQPARGKPKAYKRLGLVPEQETIYPYLTGREFVRLNAILQKVPDVDRATDEAISLVQLEEPANRRIGGYSKGMRQRIKVAAALVHDPSVVLMDEPLNGTDPVQRAGLIALIRSLGESGKTVIVSSHILSEVERFAENILVIVNGKLAAAGDFRAIREKIDTHDHAVKIRADRGRQLAAALISDPAARSVRLDGEDYVVAETNDVRAFYRALPLLAKNLDIRLFEVQPADESLSSVFSYLVER
ncbi:MAG: ABC transporter ATP-binding protein [Thermomicrobiales bacterium]